jgi:hypothetical protein
MTQVPGTHNHDDTVRTEPRSSVCPVIKIVLGVRRPPSTGLCPVALSSPSERFSAKGTAKRFLCGAGPSVISAVWRVLNTLSLAPSSCGHSPMVPSFPN